MKYLIVNADDFGASLGINRGAIEAYECGILTSASLMVGARGSEDAATRAREMPRLSIGIHMTLTEEGGSPRLDFDDATAVHSEMTRQVIEFGRLVGAAPTHLDAHHNVHRDRRLLKHFIALAQSLKVPLRENSAARYLPDFYGQWDGVTHPEQVSAANLVRMLRTKVPDGLTELSCHPGYEDPYFRTSYSRERELELRTLCDARVRTALSDLGIQLVNYLDYAQLAGFVTSR